MANQNETERLNPDETKIVKYDVSKKLRKSIKGLFYGWLMLTMNCGIKVVSSGFQVYGSTIFLSFSAGFMHSPMVLANTWFIRRRALAMTLISSAIGIGGTIITPVLAFSVQTWGWRQGAFLAGLGLILIGVPLALLVQRSPE